MNLDLYHFDGPMKVVKVQDTWQDTLHECFSIVIGNRMLSSTFKSKNVAEQHMARMEAARS